MTRLAGHAHNAYLQLATDLGVPVALVACLYLLNTSYTGLKIHMRRRGSFALFTLIFFPICVIINMAETWFFWPDNILWVVFVAVGISAARVLAGSESSRSRHRATRSGRARRLAQRPVE
jgi:O-antigen ligase